MSGRRDGERISFLGSQLPAGFAISQVTIPAASERAYVHREWAGALVVVETGQIEVECLSGRRASFASGAVLFFDSLPLAQDTAQPPPAARGTQLTDQVSDHHDRHRSRLEHVPCRRPTPDWPATTTDNERPARN
jgi:hypothetical protein